MRIVKCFHITAGVSRIKQKELSKGYDYETEAFFITFLRIFSESICFTHDVFSYFLNAV